MRLLILTLLLYPCLSFAGKWLPLGRETTSTYKTQEACEQAELSLIERISPFASIKCMDYSTCAQDDESLCVELRGKMVTDAEKLKLHEAVLAKEAQAKIDRERLDMANCMLKISDASLCERIMGN